MIAAAALGIALAAWIMAGCAWFHARVTRQRYQRDRHIAELERDLGLGGPDERGQVAQMLAPGQSLAGAIALLIIARYRR